MSSFVDNSPAPAAPDSSISVDRASIPTLGDLTAADTPVASQSYDQMLTEFTDSTGQNSIEAAADQQLSAEGQDAGASPVDEPGNTASTSPAAPAAPQLDANTQALMGLVQSMQADSARREQLLLAQIEALKPKAPEAPPVDPFADLPEKFNTPEIKEFLKVAQDKILAPYQKQMEQRIQQAQHERLTNQFASEAEQVANSVVSGMEFANTQDRQEVFDLIRDQALTLSHVHGGSPARFQQAIAKTFQKGVQAMQANLNKAAKAKTASLGQRPAAKPNAAPGMVPGQQSADYTWAEARAAGYQDMTDAVFDGGKRVLAMRARNQGRG